MLIAHIVEGTAWYAAGLVTLFGGAGLVTFAWLHRSGKWASEVLEERQGNTGQGGRTVRTRPDEPSWRK